MQRKGFAAWLAVGVWMSLVGLWLVGCTSRTESAMRLTPMLTSATISTPSLPLLPTSTPASQPSPTMTPTSMATPVPTWTDEVESVTFTIVYDNNAHDPALRTAWGFACLVQVEETTVLFDTGDDSPTLLGNMEKLGFDPQEIDIVVLFHIHGDHTGGLKGLLDIGIRPTVYVPASFPASFKNAVRARTGLLEVKKGVEIAPGVYTTGEVGSGIVEQAIAVQTKEGIVVVTGCAHPGIVEMVRRAHKVAGGEIALVMGGFHLGGASRARVERIIADFDTLGVRKVAPCHCTGDQARNMFAVAFKESFIPVGVGSKIVLAKSMH